MRRKEVLKKQFPNYRVIPNIGDIPEICPKEVESGSYLGFCDKAEIHSIACIACRIHYWNRYTSVTDFKLPEDESDDKAENKPIDRFLLFSLTGTRKED